ncbi:MAG: class I SAM-dependent methyltransferase [Janthinobacterium lividum]
MSDGSDRNVTDQLSTVCGEAEVARLRRLQLFNRFLAASSAALLEAAGVVAGSHVIDLGCGEGAMSLVLAKRVGSHGRVYAVDHDAAKLDVLAASAAQAGLSNIVAVAADVESALAQLELADFVYARFLLLHLPAPRNVLAGMRRIIGRDGKRGKILLEEPVLAATGEYPNSGLWCKPIALYERYCELIGIRPNYGQSLIADLKIAGLALQSAVQTTAVLDPAIAREYIECSLLAQRRQYIEYGLLSPLQYAALLDEVRHHDLTSIEYCRFHGVMQIICS